MERACAYCGGVHEAFTECPKKVWEKKERAKLRALDAQHRKKMEKTREYRSSRQWRRLSEAVKKRDLYKCRVCESGMFGDVRYNAAALEVHHIVKLYDDMGKRADMENLITLCPHHHKMADRGEIAAEVLLELIKKDEFY